jgi:hypothetical protein
MGQRCVTELMAGLTWDSRSAPSVVRDAVTDAEAVKCVICDRWHSGWTINDTRTTHCEVCEPIIAVSRRGGSEEAGARDADIAHGALRALEWAAKFPLGGGMDAVAAERIYALLSPLEDRLNEIMSKTTGQGS